MLNYRDFGPEFSGVFLFYRMSSLGFQMFYCGSFVNSVNLDVSCHVALLIAFLNSRACERADFRGFLLHYCNITDGMLELQYDTVFLLTVSIPISAGFSIVQHFPILSFELMVVMYLL